MAQRNVFLAGLAAGAAGGVLWARRDRGPRTMAFLDAGRQVLAETRGPRQAALLAARIQARYEELCAGGLRFDHPVLRQHYEQAILPGLALYQTLREEGADEDAALSEIDRIFEEVTQRMSQRRLVDLLGRGPDPFAVLRFLNRWALKRKYPVEGWRFEWVEDSDRSVAYDCRECFYLNVLTAAGAPELTARFCAIDDLLYGHIPGISWERTETLARGNARCNFRFTRVEGVSV